MRPRVLVVVALGALAVAYAIPMESVGCAQTSHYAATRAIAEGHPDIDRYAQETCDLVRVGGHFYAAKAPGMDVWSAPWYLLLRSAGAGPTDPDAVVGLYAAAGSPRLRRLVAFGAGGVVGLLPLLGFDWWALGSPFHLPYSGVALNPGAGGVEQTAGGHGFFTLGLPDVRVAI